MDGAVKYWNFLPPSGIEQSAVHNMLAGADYISRVPTSSHRLNRSLPEWPAALCRPIQESRFVRTAKTIIRHACAHAARFAGAAEPGTEKRPNQLLR